MRYFLFSVVLLALIILGLLYQALHTDSIPIDRPDQSITEIDEQRQVTEADIFKNQRDCFDALCGKDLFIQFDLDVFEDPFVTSNVVFKAVRGDWVVFVNSRDDWVRILISNQMGWVKRDAVSEILNDKSNSEIGFVKGSNLFRVGPSNENVDFDFDRETADWERLQDKMAAEHPDIDLRERAKVEIDEPVSQTGARNNDDQKPVERDYDPARDSVRRVISPLIYERSAPKPNGLF